MRGKTATEAKTPNKPKKPSAKREKDRLIHVEALARVEGEGGLCVKIKNNQVTEVRFKIFEPPRFFEAFLRGRSYEEAPDITARICGICPVAYQMSSVHAMEAALGLSVGGPLRELRRLLYCGEWIESHTLHVFMLHAPDFLGFEDAIQIAKRHPELVQKALRLKKIGNEIVTLLGGREIHPINVRVGGFYKAPTKRELSALVEPLQWARDFASEAVAFCAGLPMPEYEYDYEYVALRHPSEYPMNEGRLVSNRGLDIAVEEYLTWFEEEHVPYSNALHSVIRRRGAYCVGPSARYSLNFDRLTPTAQEAARRAGLGSVCRNPFQSIIIRAVEILYACEEALRIIGQYEMPDSSWVSAEPKAGSGCGCTEAPRGILFHRYILDERGMIVDARIVPPTAQNQKTMENDLRQVATKYIHISKDQLTRRCEQAIRNYDPCISCATHFLKLEIQED